MKTEQVVVKAKDLGTANWSKIDGIKPQLGFVFGPNSAFENKEFVAKLMDKSKGTQWIGCSTAGEVSKMGVTDETIVLTGLHFDNPKAKMKIVMHKLATNDENGNQKAGHELAKKLAASDLNSIIVISPGVNVNGSLLVKGLTEASAGNVVITGGLAGDGGAFKNTYTLSPEGVSNDTVIAVGFYGSAVQMHHGCMGGWEPFGKVRKVTKSKNNVVYELDGKPALDVYKEYLGDQAKGLPGVGLLYPFAILNDQKAESGLIRTILNVSEQDGSLTFAGDIAQDSLVKLMRANTAALVEGSKAAAQAAAETGKSDQAFALIVSCVGRKLVMGGNVDEEIDVISSTFGPGCALTGWYSYGEISPFLSSVGCQLHNQTMTISYIREN